MNKITRRVSRSEEMASWIRGQAGMPVCLYPAFLWLFNGIAKEVFSMDLLQSRVRPVFFKYLGAAFGSALIGSIYSMVDMAIVGQYQGPSGTAADRKSVV